MLQNEFGYVALAILGACVVMALLLTFAMLVSRQVHEQGHLHRHRHVH